MTVSFESRTVIIAPIDRVFDLSLDVDTHLESQAKSGERAVAGVTSGTIGLGEQVTWRARTFRRAVQDDEQDHRDGTPESFRRRAGPWPVSAPAAIASASVLGALTAHTAR